MPRFTGFEVAFRSMSVDVAAKMDVSSMFSSDTDSSAFALLFDVLLHEDYYERVDLGGGLSYIKRKGTGLRIAMKATKLDTKQAVNFSSVAAQASLGMANVEYRVHGIGLSMDVVESLLNVPISDKLSSTTYQALYTTIQQKLPAYLRSNAVGTGDYSVPVLARDDQPDARARAVNYAVSMIARRIPLSEVLKNKPQTISEAMVGAIYARLVPTSSETVTPEQADNASLWLASGAIS